MQNSDNSFAALVIAHKERLERTHCGIHPKKDIEQPIVESIRVGARWRNLVNGYVNQELGICAYFHTWNKAIEDKCRDFCFVFQRCGTRNVHRLESRSLGNSQQGSGLRCPRSEQVELPVPIFSGPIMQNSQVPVETSNKYGRLQIFGSLIRLYQLNPVPALLREWSDTPSGVLTVESTDLPATSMAMVVSVVPTAIGAWNGEPLIDDNVPVC